MAFGLQVATYRQLRDAVRFLRDHGARLVEIPPELHPGIEFAAHVLDPDGHCLQLYFAMQQVATGTVRARPGSFDTWPETLDDRSEVYRGEPFLGPWA
jgi:hypothetical protein